MGLSSKLVAGDGLDRSQDEGLKVPEPPGGEGKADQMEQRQGRKAAPVKCPRCESVNTKFCYYNNYSTSQPRHFCRACRRHWTDGGTLRNVPVGGSRKNKRLKTAHDTSTAVDNNGEALQWQMPLPPSDDGDGLSSIFPGILGQVLLRPPPPPLPLDYRTVGSGFYPVPPFLPEFGTAEADLMSSSDSVLNPLSSISSSSCSSPYDCTKLDPLVGEDGIAAWQAPTSSPASNLSCWDDIRDLVNAQDSVLSTFP